MKCCADAGPELKRTLEMHAPEFFGNTPLMNALFNDNEDFSVALILHHLSCGVSLNKGDFQQKTPLMHRLIHKSTLRNRRPGQTVVGQ